MVKHVLYIRDLAGIDCIGLGSDFDGIDCKLEMKDYGGFQTLIANLEREFSTETIEKICFKNVSRILKECI